MNRARMAYVFMGFLLVWYVGIVLAISWLGLGAIEGVGLGTVGGVFVKAFSDMWQFLWRKPSPEEEHAAHREDRNGANRGE